MEVILLATGSTEVENFIQSNISEEKYRCVPVLSRNRILNLVEKSNPHIVIMSSMLPGNDDIDEIIFKVQEIANSRIIFLTGGSSSKQIMNAFFLGVRDFICEPINPNYLLESITTPATFAKAISLIQGLDKQPKFSFRQKIQGFFNSNAPPPVLDISTQASQIIKGILKLTQQKEGLTVEENLMIIEDILCKLIYQNIKLS